MADPIDIDPTRADEGAAEGGAAGGGDDDTQDWSLPGGPTDAPDEQRRRRWPGGTRRKNPYAYKPLPRDDKDTPTSSFPKEKSGLPATPKNTEETSFIEGTPSGKIRTTDFMKINLANQMIQEQYPQYSKAGNLLTLKVEDGQVVVVGSRGGLTSLFKADGRTLNPQLLK